MMSQFFRLPVGTDNIAGRDVKHALAGAQGDRLAETLADNLDRRSDDGIITASDHDRELSTFDPLLSGMLGARAMAFFG